MKHVASYRCPIIRAVRGMLHAGDGIVMCYVAPLMLPMWLEGMDKGQCGPACTSSYNLCLVACDGTLLRPHVDTLRVIRDTRTDVGKRAQRDASMHCQQLCLTGSHDHAMLMADSTLAAHSSIAK